VAAIDLGIKGMTPTLMAKEGIEVHVLPATATIADVLAVPGADGTSGPDGVFFSNGPGDPATADLTLLHEVLDRRIPFFGICFGNQLLGPKPGLRHLQAQVRTQGHQPARHGPHDRQGRGHGTQPRVRRQCTHQARLADPLRPGPGQPCLPQRRRRRGLECLDQPAFSVQYHPEAAAGPHDAAYLFDRFCALMRTHPWKGAQHA
jgi:carbamoyl-phosphate synthase small subunit